MNSKDFIVFRLKRARRFGSKSMSVYSLVSEIKNYTSENPRFVIKDLFKEGIIVISNFSGSPMISLRPNKNYT